MKFTFQIAAGDWLKISDAGTLVPGGGEFGEAVVVSQAFVASLKPEVQAERGFVELIETEEPEGAIGWEIETIEGVPTQVWTVPAE